MNSKARRLSTLADIYQSQNLDGAITQLRINRIRPSEKQPRQDRTVSIEDLAHSLKKDGLLSPILVKKEGSNYRIIAGERRYHAACKLGWEQIECRIISRQEDDYWRIAIIENLQRENLSPEEESVALLVLKKQSKLSDAELANLVGKSRNYITEILGIAQLPEQVLETCRKHGIQQRNMLIQVVQSYKKGTIQEFLQKYNKGEIRTVSKARQFNQKGKQNDEYLGKIENIDKVKKTEGVSKTYAKTDFILEIKENLISIRCPNTKIAKDLSTKIQQLFHT